MRERRYIYYSSDKSEVEALAAFIKGYAGEGFDIFAGTERKERRVTLAKTAKGAVEYTDYMYVKI